MPTEDLSDMSQICHSIDYAPKYGWKIDQVRLVTYNKCMRGEE